MMKRSGDDGNGGVVYACLGVLCCVLVVSVIAVVSVRFSVSGSPFRSSVSAPTVSIVELEKKAIAATAVANRNPSRAIASDLSFSPNSSFSRKSTLVVSQFQCFLNFIENYPLFYFSTFVFIIELP